MKIEKKITEFKNIKYNPGRRRFIKQVGVGIVAVSAFSVVSLSHFSCSDSVSPGPYFDPWTGPYYHN